MKKKQKKNLYENTKKIVNTCNKKVNYKKKILFNLITPELKQFFFLPKKGGVRMYRT